MVVVRLSRRSPAEVAGIPMRSGLPQWLPPRGSESPFGSGLPIGSTVARSTSGTRTSPFDPDRTCHVPGGWICRSRKIPASPRLLAEPVTSVDVSELRATTSRPTRVYRTLFRALFRHEFPFEQLQPDRFVYVSLGTVFNNKPDVFRKILHALDSPAYQVILSVGAAYEALQKGPIPANALLFKSVPQVELLPRVDLFLSHGGNNSINEALAAGRPIVVLPIGGEQGDNASRIIYLGVGRRVDTKQFTPEQLRAVVDELRTDPGVRDKTAAISRAIAATQGPCDGVAMYSPRGLHPHPRAAAKPGSTIGPDDVERLLDNAGDRRTSFLG